jgi:hypothetical protein
MTTDTINRGKSIMKLRTNALLLKSRLAGLALLAGFGSAVAPSALAHNLDTRATSIQFAPNFVQTMAQRAATNGALVTVADEFWVLIKTTPGPGTTTGVGGYQTFYIPAGVQVLDAAYVQP